MIYICAVSDVAANSYAKMKKIPPREWQYMYGRESLEGLTCHTVLLVGNWHVKHDEQRMKEFIMSRRCWYIEDRDF